MPVVPLTLAIFAATSGTASATMLLAAAGQKCEENFWSSLETCVQPLDDNTTYVITGDIDSMWIRDSSAQVHPYIAVAEKQGPGSPLWSLIDGIVRRQAQFQRTDPYANAFTKIWDRGLDERLARGAYVSTGNYELDGGAYFFRLLGSIAAARPDAAVLREHQVHEAVRILVAMYRQEQQHAYGQSEYRYPKSEPFELPGNDGRGLPANYTGMVWGAFRPSDDPQQYAYHVPGNVFLAATLGPIARIAADVWGDALLSAHSADLRSSIVAGIREFGTTQLENGDTVYCYEVDGLGGCGLMDDANVPSLISLPYLDPAAETFDQAIYKNTRRFALSTKNPWYFEGSAGQGIGSPHTGEGYIWPLSLVMQLMTSEGPEETNRTLAILADANTGVHGLTESFNKDDIKDITREWFGWPNSLFGEYLLKSGHCDPLAKFPARLPAVRPAPPVGPPQLRAGRVPPSFYDADPAELRRPGVTLPKPEFFSAPPQAGQWALV